MTDIIANVEAEASLLGLMMIPDSGVIIDAVADQVSADDFSEPVHARIFEVILREHGLGKPVSPVFIKPFFDTDPDVADLGGVTYLAKLTEDPQGAFRPYDLAKQLADLGRRRRVREGLLAAADACADPEVSPAEIVSLADAALDSTDQSRITQLSGGECFDQLIAAFDTPDHGVRCGAIPSLDNLLGPVRPGQFVICAGRPGMGKTALGLSYSIGAARAGHGVLFVSLEMPAAQLAARMAADLCFSTERRVPFAAIRDRTLGRDDRLMVGEARDYMHKLPLEVAATGHLTVGRLGALIRRKARQMAARGQRLDLVVVDYIQLLAPDTARRTKYEEVSDVSRALKVLANSHEVGVLGLCQLSRETEKRADKHPQMSDLRDSGQLEQDADTVLLVTRQGYYLEQNEPDPGDPRRAEWELARVVAQDQIEFIVAKQRNGVTGMATGKFYGEFQAVRS